MAFISIAEIIDILIMTCALGFIFMKLFRPLQSEDPIERYTKKRNRWKVFWFSAAVVAPGIILHELAHKFVAMALGQQATFFAACSVTGFFGGPSFFDFPCLLLMATMVLSYLNFSFFIFVPGYVAHTGVGLSPLGSALIAFSGPALNGLLWLFCRLSVKKRWLNKKFTPALVISAQINMFLFFFNLLPIPPFDGFQVLMGLIHAFF